MLTRKTVTLADVASSANVAIKTASKAFNGDKTIRPYLMDRVLSAAANLGYRPNYLARGLREKTLKIVSAYVPSLDTPFFGSLLQDLHRVFHLNGLMLVPCDYIEALNNTNSALCACATILIDPNPEDVINLKKDRPIVVLSNQFSDPDSLQGVSSLSLNFESAYKKLVELILSSGMRKVAFHCASDYEINHRLKFRHVEDALASSGIRIVRPKTPPFFVDPEILAVWIKDNRVDSIFTQNDGTALTLLAELSRLGAYQPEKPIIIGCDGSFITNSVWSIVFDTKDMAKTLFELLDNELKNNTHHLDVYTPKLHIPGSPFISVV